MKTTPDHTLTDEQLNEQFPGPPGWRWKFGELGELDTELSLEMMDDGALEISHEAPNSWGGGSTTDCINIPAEVLVALLRAAGLELTPIKAEPEAEAEEWKGGPAHAPRPGMWE